MIIEDILDILISLLLMVSGSLYTLYPQWFFGDLPPEKQAQNRKLLKVFFGPVTFLLGLTLLVFQLL